jgi:hypothetical protein
VQPVGGGARCGRLRRTPLCLTERGDGLGESEQLGHQGEDLLALARMDETEPREHVAGVAEPVAGVAGRRRAAVDLAGGSLGLVRGLGERPCSPVLDEPGGRGQQVSGGSRGVRGAGRVAVHDLGDVVGGVAGGDLGMLERSQPLVRRELRSALLASRVVQLRVGCAAGTGPASLQLGQRQVRGELPPPNQTGSRPSVRSATA